MRAFFVVALVAVALFPARAGAQLPESGFQVGQAFPEISFPDLEGNDRSLADYRGQKVVLHIFASW